MLNRILIIMFTVLLTSYAGAQATPVDILTRTPPYFGDRNEPWEERRDRMIHADRAIHNASSLSELLGSHLTYGIQMQAALLALGQHESLWAEYVGEDRCEEGPLPEMRCDVGRDGKPHALGYWQVHRSICPDAFEMEPGPERLMIEAECAARYYARRLVSCNGNNDLGQVAGGLAGYRGRCRTTDASLRLKTYKVFLHVLQHGWPAPPSGWARDGNPPIDLRRRAQRVDGSVGSWVVLEPGSAALIEWHWHEFGGSKRPRGWHRGVSLFVEVE